jgi:type VI secretion system protein VasD
MVRIYELSEAGDFRQAGFFDLYDHDKSVLGNAALSRTVVAVRPNERLTLEHEVDSRSRHLAVMVAYRNIYRAKWRAVADLPDTRDSAWALTLDAGSLKIAAWGKDAAPRGASAQAGAAKSVAPRWDRLAHGGNPGGAGPDRSRQQGRNQTDRDRTGGYHVLEQ